MKRIATAFFVLLLFLAPAILCSAAEAGSYSISYIGRTFGYYRVPSIQTRDVNTCEASQVDLPQVSAMLQQIGEAGPSNLLVGLGDNFAPELASRSFSDAGKLVPKDQYTFDFTANPRKWVPYTDRSAALTDAIAQGHGILPFDNVGCFFKLAGFHALLPGKQDFHFGPERLQELARYLADPHGGKSVQMLGANLAILTTVAHPPATSEPADPPQNFTYSGPNGAQFVLPNVPLPFMRTFPIQNGVEVKGYVASSGGPALLQRLNQAGLQEGADKTATPLYSHAWICRGQLGTKFDPKGCDELEQVPVEGTTLRFKLPKRRFGLFPSASAVQPGVDYYTCASAASTVDGMTSANTLCQPKFEFHYPFFQAGIAEQPNPTPYAVTASGVVVFGVVDPELSTQIGALNSCWQNTNPAFKTRLEIADPHEALAQLLETCAEDVDCAGKRRVLLAQMSPQRAQRLASHIPHGFDVVISQADDGYATGSIAGIDRGSDSDLKPIVLTPASAIESRSPDTLRVGLATAVIKVSTGERAFDNRLTGSTVSLKRETYSGKKPLWRLMVDAGLSPRPPDEETVDGRTVVQNGILSAMRHFCKADVALLQQRDLYRPEHFAVEQPSAGELQDLLDRLLWKGDFIECHPATGAALKQAEAISQQFSSGAKNELTAEGESGRAIEALGLFTDPGSGLIINGRLAEDGQLYSIATTDFLTSGDSGYGALSAVASQGRSELTEITTLVCKSLAPALGGDPKITCRPSLQADAYVDPISMAAYAIPKGLDTAGELQEWAKQNWEMRNTLAPVKKNPAEFEAQNKRVFSIRLDRADLGYQRNIHSLSEVQQQQRFGGVQAAQPTAPERYDWTADYLLRLTSSGSNIDRFIQADAEYENSGVKQVFTTGAGPRETYELSLPQNTTGLEAGFETRLWPMHQKNITGIRLLTSFRYQTEISRPFVQFQAADGFLNATLPRGNALLAKAGLRYDGERSWLELGMQTGPQTQVQSMTLGSLTCDAGNVQACVSADASLPALNQLAGLPFHVTTVRRDQSGVFLNGRIHIPVLYKHLDYVIENQGTLSFNRGGDSPADTRYLEVMRHSLVVPVIGNFAVVPRVDIFLFQNKVTGWHIHGYQTSVTAQYRFDWHTGLKWKDVLRYPNPPESQ